MKAAKSTMIRTIALCLILVPPAFAVGVPHLMNIQGILTDDEGTPVADDIHMVDFSIYDVESVGVALWSESRAVVTTNGLFSVVLGEVNPVPASLFSGADLWLGMAMSGSPEMTPRQRLTAVPYVYRALNADSANFAFAVADDAVNSSKIADGSIMLGDLGQNGAGSGQVIKWNGSAWAPAEDEGDGGGWIDDGSVVRLSNSGDSVGIGTSAPQEKLHVDGDIRLGSMSDIAFGDDNTRVYVESGGDMVVTADDDIHLQPDDDVYMRADGGGTWVHFDNTDERLSIGTTDPLNQFHVQGTSLSLAASALHSDDVTLEDQDAVLGLYSSDAGSAGSQVTLGEISGGALVDKWTLIRETTGNNDGGLRMTFGTNADTWLNSTVAYFGQDGKVGIGITDPAEKLEVDGDIRVGFDGDIAFGGDDTRIYESSDGDLSLTADDDIYLRPDDDIFVRADGGAADWVRFDCGTSRLGIGELYPDERLHVNGNAIVEDNLEVGDDLDVYGAYKGDISSSSGSDGAPFPRPAYDSDWQSIDAGTTIILSHNVGGDTDDYFIDLQLWSSDTYGLNNRTLGGDLVYSEVSGFSAYGAYYSGVTSTHIAVSRRADDFTAEKVRVRIWVIK